MELSDRPLVLLLSLLEDNKPKNLTELTLGFQEILGKVSQGAFRPDELEWLDSVEYIIEKLRWRSFVALVDHESHKFQITVLGRWFFEKNKAEMEKHLGIAF